MKSSMIGASMCAQEPDRPSSLFTGLADRVIPSNERRSEGHVLRIVRRKHAEKRSPSCTCSDHLQSLQHINDRIVLVVYQDLACIIGR